MEDKFKAHCRPEKGTDVLIDFQREKEKRQTKVCKGNKKGNKAEQDRHSDDYSSQDEKKGNKIFIFGKIFVVAVVITWILENFLYKYLHYVVIGDIIASVLSFFGMVASVVADNSKTKKYYGHLSYSDRFLVGREIHKRIWREKPVFTYYLVILIIGNAVIFGSKYTICARAAELANDIKEFVVEFFDNTAEKEGRPEVEPVISNEEKVNNDEESSDDEKVLYSYTEQEIIEQLGEENYWLVKNIIISEADMTRELYLSSVDYNALFQLEGEFKIEDWDNQEEIDAVVLKMIEDEISLKKQNRFDTEASDLLQANVNAANMKEAEMHTFDERIEIIEIREDAYRMYHKSSLAQLIANDNQALSLALVLNGGNKQTELYYYGESIFWGLEYLGFADVSTSAVKEKVNWIGERYKDIRSICSEMDPEYMYAEKLMIAYKHAADKL